MLMLHGMGRTAGKTTISCYDKLSNSETEI